jgi:cytochrome bd ubiquinol oxidase subunit I
LERLRSGAADAPDADAQRRFAAHQADLGYGLLLLRYTDNPAQATAQQIDAAAWSTVPNVPVLFWSFRIMVGLGIFFILLFSTAFYLSTRHRFEQHPWFLKLAFLSLPLPWIAAELGWIVAEYGRQPWAIDGVLPTFLGVSRTAVANVWLSLLGFVVFYTTLAIIDIFLMMRMIRRGPDGLGYWPIKAAVSPA